jgi:hypothetical protein
VTESISTHKLRSDNVNFICARSAYYPQGVHDRVRFESEGSGEIA